MISNTETLQTITDKLKFIYPELVRRSPLNYFSTYSIIALGLTCLLRFYHQELSSPHPYLILFELTGFLPFFLIWTTFIGEHILKSDRKLFKVSTNERSQFLSNFFLFKLPESNRWQLEYFSQNLKDKIKECRKQTTFYLIFLAATFLFHCISVGSIAKYFPGDWLVLILTFIVNISITSYSCFKLCDSNYERDFLVKCLCLANLALAETTSSILEPAKIEAIAASK